VQQSPATSRLSFNLLFCYRRRSLLLALVGARVCSLPRCHACFTRAGHAPTPLCLSRPSPLMRRARRGVRRGVSCTAVRFEFDAIHQPYATQEEVFAAVKPLCESVLDGYNITVLAYGQVC
jgi:hypothetical protein